MLKDPGLVAILAYEGLCTFEFGIAIEIFGLPRPEFDFPWYRHCIVAVDGPELRAMGGIRVLVDRDLSALEEARTIIVPGWRSLDETPPQPLLDALRAAHARGARLLSICSGVVVLAAAGVLDGLKATSHWHFADRVARRYPRIDFDPNVLYVDAGQVITSAGSAAGIDACLHLVARDFGTHVANAVARRLVMAPQRSGGQAQFIPTPVSATARHGLPKLLQWVREHLHEPITIAQMAAQVAMSERNFLRRFTETTGLSPKLWLQQERIGRARELLETTALGTVEIAERCGYRAVESFRAAFRSAVGLSPSAYRERFGARLPKLEEAGGYFNLLADGQGSAMPPSLLS